MYTTELLDEARKFMQNAKKEAKLEKEKRKGKEKRGEKKKGKEEKGK